jgi:hypothetical protein
MRYKRVNTENIVVMRIDEDGKSRVSLLVDPPQPGTQYYDEYKTWLDAGGIVEPVDVQPLAK